MRVALLSFLLAVFVTGSALAAWNDDFEKGKLALNSRRTDEAVNIFTNLINGKSLSKEWRAAVLFHRAKAYKQKKDWGKAIADLNEAIKIDAKQPGPYFELGTVYHYSGSYGDALDAFAKAIELKPGNYTYHFSRCSSAAAGGRSGVVMEECNNALKLRPGDLQSLKLIGRAYEDARNCSAAEDIYNRILKADPGNRSASEGLEQIRAMRQPNIDPRDKCKS
jgi:tetratricopeptide (TPR) repeat protein